MPIALLVALATSLGLHVALLFGPDVEVATEPETVIIAAELRPLPAPQPLLAEELRQRDPERPAKPPRKKRVAAKAAAPVVAPPQAESRSADEVAALPEVVAPAPDVAEGLDEAASAAAPAASAEALAETDTGAASAPAAEPASEPAAEPRLPPHGRITYRVDRGDSNFEIGFSRQEWEIVDNRYHLRSVVETTGLVWLFKPYRFEMESRGEVTASGLRPDAFAIRRNGRETNEKAVFDWNAMKVRVGNQPEQALAKGAQDLLSFNYDLGFLAQGEFRGTLPIATGKKYGIYRLEIVGDEDIEVPAGVLRTLHLRAPGANTTELWLAYDYLLLPVKIRHVDNKGDSLVQVATEIRLGDEETDAEKGN